jgi:hypothetical protein
MLHTEYAEGGQRLISSNTDGRRCAARPRRDRTARMPLTGFPESAIGFLGELSRNNDRAWFEAHRAACEAALIEPAKALVERAGAFRPQLPRERRAALRCAAGDRLMLQGFWRGLRPEQIFAPVLRRLSCL